MPPIPDPSNDGNCPIRGRELHKHRLLNRAVSETFFACAYPVSEAEGLHFWSILLPRLGLTYLCSPGRNRAPDAYWAVTSKLTALNRRLIRKGLRKGVFDQSLFDDGVVLGIEFESRASYAKKHFLADGEKHISQICCNDNDWRCAPVPVWCLRDFLGGQQTVVAPIEPVAFDGHNFDALSKSIESDAQRFVLLAFLSPDSRQVASAEWRLHASAIKRRANQIAVLNGYDRIKDIGGALTGFTQPGLKKDMQIIRKGERARYNRCRGSNYYLAKFRACLPRLAEVAHLQLPEDWNT
jgi:hypothetical protein